MGIYLLFLSSRLTNGVISVIVQFWTTSILDNYWCWVQYRRTSKYRSQVSLKWRPHEACPTRFVERRYTWPSVQHSLRFGSAQQECGVASLYPACSIICDYLLYCYPDLITIQTFNFEPPINLPAMSLITARICCVLVMQRGMKSSWLGLTFMELLLSVGIWFHVPRSLQCSRTVPL